MTTRSCLAGVAVCLIVAPSMAADSRREQAPAPKPRIELMGFRTAKEAIKADKAKFRFDAPATGPGYLGVQLEDRSGRPAVADVEPESAADKAGIKAGDVLLTVGSEHVASIQEARDKLRGRFAGDDLKLTVSRDGKTTNITAKLNPISKPLKADPESRGGGGNRPVLGFQLDPVKDGMKVASITPGGGADKAGIKSGDVIVKLDGKPLEGDDGFRTAVSGKRPGDVVTVFLKRGAEELELRATLGSDTVGGGRFGGRGGASGWDDRLPTTFRKPAYKLAAIGVEYPDAKHSDKISARDWEDALFSTGTFTDKNVTGQSVYGSLNDYYQELSYGTLKVTGRFVGWVEVGKKKMDYNLGTSTSMADKAKFFTEMMDKYYKDRPKDALDGFDGIFVVFAGERVQTSRGGLYWPHRSNFMYSGKRWSYFIVPELRGSGRMTDTSVICHEFGHMLGLPDLYARPENPGSEGVGVWDAMSQQNGDGRPQHFSAWSKEQMGWVKPVIVDPRVPQKIVLAPVEDSPAECVKIPVRADLSEYFLLENRQKRGFDKTLPAEGLLIWRVMPGGRGGQPVYLEESHGIEGAAGPRSFPASVPFPSPSNHAFTPYTTPSSKSQLGGGLDVYITNIRRVPDGRITFQIGYEYE
jgi:M6 family metalloprotease-like protein